MSFDPKTYRNSKDGIGGPADDRATDSTSAWTMVSLLKGIYNLLSSGSATAANQATGNASLSSMDTKLTTLNFNTDTLETAIGITAETAPATDTASSGLNGRLQRVAQRLTSLIALVPASLGQKAMTASLAVTVASDQSPVATAVTKAIVAASSTITRPADTTAYASGDLVANSTTAGSVNALQFTTAARLSGGSGSVVGARIQKSTASVTSAAFRLHLFDTTPTFTSAGDNSAISTVVVASAKGYIGYIDITAMTGFSDVAWGTGAPDNTRNRLTFKAVAQTLFGIIEARGAYTPGNAEVFTIAIMVEQD